MRLTACSMEMERALEAGRADLPGLAGARWHRCSTGGTLLHLAAVHGRADACYRLLRAGIHPAAVDRAGRYAEDVATVPWITAYLRGARHQTNLRWLVYV